MDKEYVDKVERLATEYTKGLGLHNMFYVQNFLDYLRSQVEPEYPCPACGEEMVVLLYGAKFHGHCNNVDCAVADTTSHYNRQELKEALKL